MERCRVAEHCGWLQVHKASGADSFGFRAERSDYQVLCHEAASRPFCKPIDENDVIQIEFIVAVPTWRLPIWEVST